MNALCNQHQVINCQHWQLGRLLISLERLETSPRCAHISLRIGLLRRGAHGPWTEHTPSISPSLPERDGAFTGCHLAWVWHQVVGLRTSPPRQKAIWELGGSSAPMLWRPWPQPPSCCTLSVFHELIRCTRLQLASQQFLLLAAETFLMNALGGTLQSEWVPLLVKGGQSKQKGLYLSLSQNNLSERGKAEVSIWGQISCPPCCSWGGGWESSGGALVALDFPCSQTKSLYFRIMCYFRHRTGRPLPSRYTLEFSVIQWMSFLTSMTEVTFLFPNSSRIFPLFLKYSY